MEVPGLTVEQVDRLSAEFERLVERQMRATANAAARNLGERLEARGSTADVSSGDINIMFQLWDEAVDERLLSALEGIWLDSANHSRAAIEDALPALTAAVNMPDATDDPGAVAPPPPPKPPNPFVRGSVAAAGFLLKAKNRLRGIGNEMWANARISLTEGMSLGESIPNLTRRVRSSVPVSTSRARTIARTEVIGASNGGSIAAMRSTEGLVTRKTWLATLDDRTRDDHLLADGQTVDLGEKFIMDDGSELDHPGDPAGPAEQVINCRCTMTYEVEMPPLPSPITAATVSDATGMIALRPADPSEFVVEGGDPADELHVTLCFLGGDVTEEMSSAAVKSAEMVADSVARRVQARVAGYGVLGDEDAVVLFLNGDDIAEAHTTLHQTFEEVEGTEQIPAQHAPWLAHLTLGYGLDVKVAEQFIGREFEIDAITVDVGNEQVGRFVFGDDADTVRPRTAAAFQGEGGVMPVEGARARWRGVMVVEDTPTGDGRQFAADSLTWPDMPLPLQWQKETSHGGINDVTVTVGTIESIERVGNELIGEGLIDLETDDGRDVYRRVLSPEEGGLGLGGVSIVADDPENAEVEYQYPDGCEELDERTEDEIESEVPIEELMRCFEPEVVIFHSGRVRALTIVDTPAFVEAKIEVMDEAPADDAEVATVQKLPIALTVAGKTYQIGEIESPEELPTLLTEAAEGVLQAFTPVASHETGTSEDPWDGAQNEARLPSPMPTSTGENAYAWIDREAVEDGEMPKTAGRFIHHNVSEDGQPGAANITACQTAIGVLNGGRGGTTIPNADREGVYNHLARHLRDADVEPPELQPADSEGEEAEAEIPDHLVAAAYTVTIPDVPTLDWYTEPADLPPIGAIEVTEDGRIYGLLAPKDALHRGFKDQKIPVPMGNVDYSTFMNRATPVVLADGTVEKIPTGIVTMNCGHAKATPSVGTEAALEHYDNSCSVAATVRVGENSRGVWVAGALMPGIDAHDLARFMGCQLSGDWRPSKEHPGMRELTAAHVVPVPGFAAKGPTIRLDHGELVAASAPIHFHDPVEKSGWRVPSEVTVTAAENVEIKTFSTEGVQDDESGPEQPENGAPVDEPGTSAGEDPATEGETESDAQPSDTGTASAADLFADLPDFEETLAAMDPKAQVAAMQRELGLDPQSKLQELVASVKGDD